MSPASIDPSREGPLGLWTTTFRGARPARVERWRDHVREYFRPTGEDFERTELSDWFARRVPRSTAGLEGEVCRALARGVDEATLPVALRPTLRFWRDLDPSRVPVIEATLSGPGAGRVRADADGLRCLEGWAAGSERRLDRLFFEGPGGEFGPLPLPLRRALREGLARAAGFAPAEGFPLLDYAQVRGRVRLDDGGDADLDGHRVTVWMTGVDDAGLEEKTPWFHGAEEVLGDIERDPAHPLRACALVLRAAVLGDGAG